VFERSSLLWTLPHPRSGMSGIQSGAITPSREVANEAESDLGHRQHCIRNPCDRLRGPAELVGGSVLHHSRNLVLRRLLPKGIGSVEAGSSSRRPLSVVWTVFDSTFTLTRAGLHRDSKPWISLDRAITLDIHAETYFIICALEPLGRRRIPFGPAPRRYYTVQPRLA